MTVAPTKPTPPPPPDDNITADKTVRPSLNDVNEQKVAAELRRRWLEVQSADREWLQNYKFELDFLDNHWLDEETGREVNRAFIAKGRAAFHIDLLNPAIDLIVNVARLQKTTVTFVPISEGADQATADIRQGLYRNIDRVSKAAIARETAYQLAVSVGRAYWRVNIVDEDGPTFNRRISIDRVDNLSSIGMDPTCLDFTYSDAGWGWAFDYLHKEEFKALYGDATPDLDLYGMGLADDQRADWFPEDKVRLVEYFRRVWKMRTVWQLQDGSSVWKDKAPAEYRSGQLQPVREKDKLDYVIEWRKMTGTQTLEKRLWPGRFIPIIVVIGREVFRGRRGKIHRGMVRPAIDPVRIHDVMFSRVVDEVGLSPLPHFIAYTGQLVPEQKQILNQINNVPWSVIEINPTLDETGRPLPISGWVSPSANTQAVVQAAELAKTNLDRTLNTYAPNRGQAISDQSGRAIREIKDSGDISHAAFPDNFNRALMQEAEVVNDLMDVVYTDPQAITITQPDDTTKRVLINQAYVDPKTGRTMHHVFGSAKYGVAPQPGQPYPTRMAEAGQKLLDLAKMFPGEMAKVLYLLIEDLNVPNSERYSEVLAPPGVKGENGPTVPQLMQQIQQMEQTTQQGETLIQKLLDRVAELGNAKSMKILELASKERIAAASDRAEIVVAEVKAGQDAEQSVLNARLEYLLKSLENDPDLAAQQSDIQSKAPPDSAAPSQPVAPPAPAGSPLAPPPDAGAPPPAPPPTDQPPNGQ